MDKNKIDKGEALNRRKFLNIAGIAATASIISVPSFAKEKYTDINDSDLLINERSELPGVANKIADVIEEKTICIQPGKFYGDGTKYQLNTNGHVVAKDGIIEPNRYIGWPTVLKTNEGQLIVAFSGDRDAHVCPYGKNQIISSDNFGTTWSEPITINSTQLDDRDAGFIQTKKTPYY